jgi:hypothetical protein
VALQVEASVEDQFKVDDEPEIIVVGLAEKVSVGTGGGLTVNVADWLVVPPTPVQVRV